MKQLSILKEPQWRACTLVSGSSGNSVFLAAGRTKVLVMPELRRRALKKLCVRSVKMLLIWMLFSLHEHSDHVRGVGPLARRYKIPIYTNARTFEAMGRIWQLVANQVELFTSGNRSVSATFVDSVPYFP